MFEGAGKKSDIKSKKSSGQKQLKKSMIHSSSKEANLMLDKKKDKFSKQSTKKQESKKKKNKVNVNKDSVKVPSTGTKSLLKTLTLSKNS